MVFWLMNLAVFLRLDNVYNGFKIFKQLKY